VTLSFSELALVEPLQRALLDEKYDNPTPIQAQAIPHLLAGRDLLGIAQTGTGKTAAFALPILQRLSANRTAPQRGNVRALILTPTRELAIQIGESFRAYGRHMGLRHAVIFGGVGQKPQVDALQRGLDILVATPGRLLDLMQQRHTRFDTLEVFVLDEADRMLDMGFIHDVKRIVAALPKTRQNLLFSATMPATIASLAASMLKDPVRVEVTPAATTVELIDQRIYHVAAGNKRALLADMLKDKALARVLVFTRTKHGANRVAEQLARGGFGVEAIHGNKSQAARQRALLNFRNGRTRVLVATDIAARGIDIDDISHVVNYDIPNESETYVHRIGRTARAGAKGIALTFCDPAERGYLRDIEKLTRRSIAVVADHPFVGMAPANGAGQGQPRGQHQPHGNPNGQHRGHRQQPQHRGRRSGGGNGQQRRPERTQAGV
jgi:ATP-dependent RNA helicase RhlE